MAINVENVWFPTFNVKLSVLLRKPDQLSDGPPAIEKNSFHLLKAEMGKLGIFNKSTQTFMKIMQRFVILVICFIFWIFIQEASNLVASDVKFIQSQALSYFKAIPSRASPLDQAEASSDKILLGKMLFFDPRLSSSHLISCHSCHNFGLSAADLQETSIGHGWQKGIRNAPTVLNAVFNSTQFWDGRAADLQEQAKEPILSALEMNNTSENLINTLESIPRYVTLFNKVFIDQKTSINLENVANAIAAFEATLLTPDSRFDLFLKGDIGVLNKNEVEGLNLFMDRNCSVCHYGRNVGGKDFFVFGRLLDPKRKEVRPVDDLGRHEITGLPHDKYVFRAASLRNVERTAPYFHSGKVWTLNEAIETMAFSQLGYSPSKEDVFKLAAFLKTLTGLQPKVELPELPANTSITPRPKL